VFADRLTSINDGIRHLTSILKSGMRKLHPHRAFVDGFEETWPELPMHFDRTRKDPLGQLRVNAGECRTNSGPFLRAFSVPPCLRG